MIASFLRSTLPYGFTRVYPKVTELAAWSENCKWCSSATSCSCVAILWVSLVSFAAITLCVAFQRVFIVISIISLSTQSRNFWIHPRSSSVTLLSCLFFIAKIRYCLVTAMDMYGTGSLLSSNSICMRANSSPDVSPHPSRPNKQPNHGGIIKQPASWQFMLILYPGIAAAQINNHSHLEHTCIHVMNWKWDVIQLQAWCMLLSHSQIWLSIGKHSRYLDQIDFTVSWHAVPGVPEGKHRDTRVYPKFPNCVDNEININKHSLRSNTRGYGGKTH
jgi:hypothetical protein